MSSVPAGGAGGGTPPKPARTEAQKQESAQKKREKAEKIAKFWRAIDEGKSVNDAYTAADLKFNSYVPPPTVRIAITAEGKGAKDVYPTYLWRLNGDTMTLILPTGSVVSTADKRAYGTFTWAFRAAKALGATTPSITMPSYKVNRAYILSGSGGCQFALVQRQDLRNFYIKTGTESMESDVWAPAGYRLVAVEQNTKVVAVEAGDDEEEEEEEEEMEEDPVKKLIVEFMTLSTEEKAAFLKGVL